MIIFLCALAALLALTPLAKATPASYKGSSAEGKVVFFETADQLVPGDTDNKRDVYERFYDGDSGIETYVTREVSLGPAGGNDAFNATFEKANAEGTRVFFSTEEALVEEDTDRQTDLYMREPEGGETTLVSRGETACFPICGSGPFAAGFAGASANGEKIFFVSQERLMATDKDSSVDIYERNLGSEETTLVSAGATACVPECGNGPHDATLRGVSRDGSYVYFTSEEALAPGVDGDSSSDIYARELGGAGETTLVSQAGEACAGCGNDAKVPVFHGSSEDGSRVFFTTDEKLVGSDNDGATDIYARDLPGGPTRLISGGSEAKTASFAASSSDGTRVFFTTAEPLLVPEDGNSANDIYEWSGGTLSLVTSAACSSECGAAFDAVSDDSETVVFSSFAQLSADDEDTQEDIYTQEVGSGVPVLASQGCGGCGSGSAAAGFNRASADASHVVFTTSEVLSPEDTDEEGDIYARDVPGEETSLITTSPSYCPLKKGNCGATFVGASADGRQVFFTTVERFKLEDGDDEVDVYERFLGATPDKNVTRLISTGNDPNLDLGPAPPLLEATNPASPAASTTPRILGKSDTGSTVKIYTTSSCSGEPVAHGTAAQLVSPGIGVTAPAGQTSKFWATAEAEGFVSLCSSPISYTQQSISSGEGGEGGGGQTGGGSTEPIAPKKTSTLAPPSSAPVYLTPHTRITFAPAAKTRKRNPVFRFTDSTGQVGTKFSCKVDHGHWKRCSSPLRLKRLKRGRHALEIKAVNAVGTPEPRPAKRSFKVVPG